MGDIQTFWSPDFPLGHDKAAGASGVRLPGVPLRRGQAYLDTLPAVPRPGGVCGMGPAILQDACDSPGLSDSVPRE